MLPPRTVPGCLLQVLAAAFGDRRVHVVADNAYRSGGGHVHHPAGAQRRGSTRRPRATPGTSAMFVMISDAVVDKVREAFAGQRPKLISTNLSKEQEDRLREAFAETE